MLIIQYYNLRGRLLLVWFAASIRYYAWGKITPMKWVIFIRLYPTWCQLQKRVCSLQIVNPKPPNILHRFSIWIKCIGAWGNITPIKWIAFIFWSNIQLPGVILNGLFLFTQLQKRACYSQNIYPRSPKNLHGYIRHIRDISQLCAIWPRYNLHCKCQKFSYAIKNSWIQTSTRKKLTRSQ